MNKTQIFIQKEFARYYMENAWNIRPPTSIEKREFAFLLFKERTMLRHKGFRNPETFRDFLQSVPASDIYYSSAYFDNPEEAMSAKSWTGADLIFDIDADHIPTPCNKEHDMWACKNCGMSKRGARPRKCPKCKGQKFDYVSWPCDICLESAKRETIKLTEVLEEDFGFSHQEMAVAFSGHRGYHVHVENDAVKTLDSMSRKEIVDYVTGIGLKSSLHGFDFEKAKGPNLEDPGWRGRIAKGTYELLNSRSGQLENDGLTRIPWGLISGIGAEGWEKIIKQAVEKQSVKIDTVVTADIHRLIRLANTLHGETGLKKTEVQIAEIEAFDPFKKAVAFKNGLIKLVVTDAPEFRLGDQRYGPFKKEEVDLPTNAAMFLICKGAAEVLEECPSV